LENQCFVGHILEYKGIIVEYTTKESAKQRNEKKAHPNIKSGPINGKEAAQAHSETDQRKVVARRLHLGVAKPKLRPHPCLCQPGLASSDGIINALGG
jgi:acyl CoA:acetate/3-ketoacid CoA transferase